MSESGQKSAVGGRVLTAALWTGLAVATPALASRWVDSSIGVVAVLQAFLPVVALGVAALLLVAVVVRRWRVAVVAGILLSVCAAVALPSLIGHEVDPGRDDLRVTTANLEYGGADAQSLVAAARRYRVDVMVLIEITPAAVERLKSAGLDLFLPESVGRPSEDAGGTIIRSRIPLTLLEDPGPGHESSDFSFDQPVVSIHRPAGDVVLRAVHSLPPTPWGTAEWRSGLADLQAWRERQPANQPLVMAGDYNASQSHPGFRRVAETMTDAHRAAGQGWAPTWPQGRRLIRPFIQLDHVLVRGLGVVDAGVVHLPGTDHAAVWAHLSPQHP